ncbi:MAG: transporter [bacterium]
MSATPQRPSFSTNTSTTYPGWLEFEFGITADEHIIDSPLVLKLGFTTNTEFFVGISPLVRVSNGVSETGFGDVAIGARTRFRDGKDNSPSFAGQFSIKLPTADEDRGLGSGEVDFNFLVILSQIFEDFGVDLNGGISLIGTPAAGHDAHFLGILTLSKTLAPKVSGYAELFLNHNFASNDKTEDAATFIASVGASYSVSPRLVLDAAINLNISNAPFDIQVLWGVTHALTKIK